MIMKQLKLREIYHFTLSTEYYCKSKYVKLHDGFDEICVGKVILHYV